MYWTWPHARWVFQTSLIDLAVALQKHENNSVYMFALHALRSSTEIKLSIHLGDICCIEDLAGNDP